MRNPMIQAVLEEMESYLLGKREALEFALTCLLARGHLLIEDVPGVGKTTLAKNLAQCFTASFNRVQFTSDLLPSDLTGVTIYRQSTETFEFNKGPIFTNVLLADEINRANPKTQSALLEAMHDNQISHEGTTYPLPDPFFVIATQNSEDQHGTFPLPESQLDRFFMKISLGYPDESHEKRVIAGKYQKRLQNHNQEDGNHHVEDLKKLQAQADRIHVAEDVLDFMYQIIRHSRSHQDIRVGVSPRGGQHLYKACQAYALVSGRDFVSPDDVVALVPLVCGHRMMINRSLTALGQDAATQFRKIFEDILAGIKAPV